MEKGDVAVRQSSLFLAGLPISPALTLVSSGTSLVTFARYSGVAEVDEDFVKGELGKIKERDHERGIRSRSYFYL